MAILQEVTGLIQMPYVKTSRKEYGSDRTKVWFPMIHQWNIHEFPSPVLGITSIKINDEERDIQDKIILPPGHYKIQIDFRGISLKEPTLVTYQYKLDGYDSGQRFPKNTSVTYNQLSEGDYTFILNASSGDGAVTEDPLTLSIIIKKPSGRNGGFMHCWACLLIMLTIHLYKTARVQISDREKNTRRKSKGTNK